MTLISLVLGAILRRSSRPLLPCWPLPSLKLLPTSSRLYSPHHAANACHALPLLMTSNEIHDLRCILHWTSPPLNRPAHDVQKETNSIISTWLCNARSCHE